MMPLKRRTCPGPSSGPSTRVRRSARKKMRRQDPEFVYGDADDDENDGSIARESQADLVARRPRRSRAGMSSRTQWKARNNNQTQQDSSSESEESSTEDTESDFSSTGELDDEDSSGDDAESDATPEEDLEDEEVIEDEETQESRLIPPRRSRRNQNNASMKRPRRNRKNINYSEQQDLEDEEDLDDEETQESRLIPPRRSRRNQNNDSMKRPRRNRKNINYSEQQGPDRESEEDNGDVSGPSSGVASAVRRSARKKRREQSPDSALEEAEDQTENIQTDLGHMSTRNSRSSANDRRMNQSEAGQQNQASDEYVESEGSLTEESDSEDITSEDPEGMEKKVQKKSYCTRSRMQLNGSRRNRSEINYDEQQDSNEEQREDQISEETQDDMTNAPQTDIYSKLKELADDSDKSSDKDPNDPSKKRATANSPVEANVSRKKRPRGNRIGSDDEASDVERKPENQVSLYDNPKPGPSSRRSDVEDSANSAKTKQRPRRIVDSDEEDVNVNASGQDEMTNTHTDGLATEISQGASSIQDNNGNYSTPTNKKNKDPIMPSTPKKKISGFHNDDDTSDEDVDQRVLRSVKEQNTTFEEYKSSRKDTALRKQLRFSDIATENSEEVGESLNEIKDRSRQEAQNQAYSDQSCDDSNEEDEDEHGNLKGFVEYSEEYAIKELEEELLSLSRQNQGFIQLRDAYYKSLEQKEKLINSSPRKRFPYQPYAPLIEGLREYATRPDLEPIELLREFVLYEVVDSKSTDEECVCGKKGLRYLFFMHNKYVVDPVKRALDHTICIGSECINRFAEAEIAHRASLLIICSFLQDGISLTYKGHRKKEMFFETRVSNPRGIKKIIIAKEWRMEHEFPFKIKQENEDSYLIKLAINSKDMRIMSSLVKKQEYKVWIITNIAKNIYNNKEGKRVHGRFPCKFELRRILHKDTFEKILRGRDFIK